MRLPGIAICSMCSMSLTRKLPELKSKAIHILQAAGQPTIVTGYFFDSLTSFTLSSLEFAIDRILYQIRNGGIIDIQDIQKAEEAIRFVDNSISRFDLVLLKYT